MRWSTPVTDTTEWVREREPRGTDFLLGQIVRGECGDCHEDGLLLYDTPLPHEQRLVCNTCVRLYPRDRRQPCDKCGARGNVWRDPIPRKNVYLCVQCHDPEAMFVNRWANKARESKALGIRQRPACAAAGYGTDCKGEVRWDSKQRMSLCNFHRGRRSANPDNN